MGFGIPIVGAAVCLLSLAAPSMGATNPSPCDFQADCRPNESYRLAIPCEDKCASYIQCQDGVGVEKKCGKFFWHQKQFDAKTLECVQTADCDWWRISTTTTAPTTMPTTTSTPSTPSTTTPEPTTTSPSTITTVPSTVKTTTEATSTSPAPTTTTTNPSSTTPPASAAAPLAAALPALLAAILALVV